ncbi:MAG: ABC transporter permease subunit [Rhizobiales bacterium]|nr:ABC transporter permease subunit [Hyphomicrobiales bacterium]
MIGWLKQPASETQVTHLDRLWLYALSGLIMLFLVAPTLIVIPMSFSDSQYLEFPPRNWSLRWYENYFGSVAWQKATIASFTAAFLTMLVATPIGVMAAYGLHASNVPFARMVYVVLITPMMVPLILIAIGAFYVYVKMKVLYTMAGLVLAHSLLALPLVLIVVASGLKSYDMNQEMAARSLGANRATAFFTVTLPQIRFSVVTAALLAFLTSFDEVVVAMFLSGGENATLTRNMFNALRDQIDPTIAAISTIMIAVTTLLMVLAQVLGRSR